MFKQVFIIHKSILICCTLIVTFCNTIAVNDNLNAFVPDDLSYRYETNTGITRVENYELKNLQQPVIVNFGSYEYTDANGRKVSVQYTADENGFVPHVKILGYSEPQVRGYPGASSALIASLVG